MASLQCENTPEKERLLKQGWERLAEKRCYGEDNALDCFHSVLLMDPDCGEAYLGRVCAFAGVTCLADLGRCSRDFTQGSPNYDKAKRLASPALREYLEQLEAENKAYRAENAGKEG